MMQNASKTVDKLLCNDIFVERARLRLMWEFVDGCQDAGVRDTIKTMLHNFLAKKLVTIPSETLFVEFSFK